MPFKIVVKELTKIRTLLQTYDIESQLFLDAVSSDIVDDYDPLKNLSALHLVMFVSEADKFSWLLKKLVESSLIESDDRNFYAKNKEDTLIYQISSPELAALIGYNFAKLKVDQISIIEEYAMILERGEELNVHTLAAKLHIDAKVICLILNVLQNLDKGELKKDSQGVIRYIKYFK